MTNTGAVIRLKLADLDDDFCWVDASRLSRFLDSLGISGNSSNLSPLSIPYSAGDTTIGVENELQTVVEGENDAVDLPVFIKSSNYYKNITKRSLTGDTHFKALQNLDTYLNENTSRIWENSWVNFPRSALSEYATTILETDVCSDKSHPGGPRRSDLKRFFHLKNGSLHIRIPVSYLLKLSLADAVSPPGVNESITRIGESLMNHFLNDNTSPETYSFCPITSGNRYNGGKGIARETLKRFLLTQFLAVYANKRFQLNETGQRVLVYFAPNTPIRQKRLNDLIPDAFYRELFMSPCLSGWNRGEDKNRYMELCHQVLSRSQLNALAKLKEAGIITQNLVILPNTSNTSLTNNGTHVSLGSSKLTRLLSDKASGFKPADEKYFGDLAIKIIEHFLPLFVGSYSAAPYRLDFNDFHPEKVLGFLPHELDYTHIRMMWRRWKNKACLKFLGHSLTPFGPEWLDGFISRALRLKGDFVTDFRLIDYLVCLMSTDESSALNGRLGNDEQLKKDLSDLGIFDPSMSLYLFCRGRQFQTMGFSGFENRLYSQFYSIQEDLAGAADLQQLLTAYAFKCILSGKISHHCIPDDPFTESERRQVIFGSAIGIPTFYVKIDTRNQLLAAILKRTRHTRKSRRYHGYIRVLNIEYARALIGVLKTDAPDLIEAMNMGPVILDLENRLNDPVGASTEGKLTRKILESANASNPLELKGAEFNAAAEKYYRDGLRMDYLNEAFDVLEQDFIELDSWKSWRQGIYNRPLLSILNGKRPQDFLRRVKKTVISETVSEADIRKLIHLTLLTVDKDIQESGNAFNG